ncbi:MAG TPA: NAD(P)-binding domain-containing protein [Acidimicrobiales bacterium]
MTEPRTPVTVLGLGALGTAVAEALVAAGHPTTVWNRTPGRAEGLAARGATVAATPRQALGASPLAIACVSTYDALAGILAPAEGSLAGRTLVNLVSGTPETARDMAARVGRGGATYLDGAAMSGTRLIGRPEALFLYSGDADAFAAHRPVLRTLGGSVHLGPDAGTAPLYDTALFGLNMAVLAGFHHAAALVGTAGVGAAELASVATGYLPFVLGLLPDQGRQVDQRRYHADEGTLAVLDGALEHLASASRERGLATDLPDALRAIVRRGIAAGHGDEGVATLAEVARA